ncbi:hypothetical protein MRX58_13160 (plasmid) [Xylella fastidiosa subsp. pauca]|uniref:hypothetical protein n=1 Tax=Xylella fastidiosa TaxID=2371 RepID=UPI00241D5914|nr:hypothetical protein [Xylella fastidiosa]MDG5824448.1 hypothetical protein [Xylella fastidiosa subsp. pauca]
MLALLNLPEQAKRLVIENVSADVEVINTVKMVEKINPVKAKELVDDLKKTRGKENARDKAAAVKEEVKPSKKPKADNGEKTPKGRSHEELGQLDVFAGAKFDPFSDAHNGSESPRPLILSLLMSSTGPILISLSTAIARRRFLRRCRRTKKTG